MNSEQTKYKVLKSVKTKLGNSIELIGERDFSNCPLIIGVFHGDEPQGKYLIEEYLNTNFPLSPTLSLEGGGSKGTYSQFAKLKSRELRLNQTDAEQKMWNLLRAKRFYGLKFKRQQPIGNYIADFVCFEKNLIIEIDGGQHNENENIIKDNTRTKYFENLGYKVIRFWNNEVLENIDGVVEYIKNSLPPRGGGGGKLFIPGLNPDGMMNNTRVNANGVDLNRNFPTKNWGEDTSAAGDNPSDYFGGKSAASEIETRFLIDVIEEYKPSVILTLHAPYKVVNYDGPARDVAEKISKIINYPTEESIGYPTPGSFGTWAGVERNIPVITLELDEKIPVNELVKPVFEIFDTL